MNMRSNMYGPETYLLKSKKPREQALVAACYNMTDDEIRALTEKPNVIKGLLNIKKLKMNEESASRAEVLADMMTRLHHPELFVDKN